ncbi:hypothetical protein N2152v2_006251 [Parachlorella kessleri]
MKFFVDAERTPVKVGLQGTSSPQAASPPGLHEADTLLTLSQAGFAGGLHLCLGMVISGGQELVTMPRCREYQDFRVGSDGELQGVGLLIAADPSSGRLVVLAPIKGSPAERAGIQPGDTVVSVNGDSTEGWDNDNLAKHLRGTEGSAVWVEVARQRGEGEQIPGVAGIRYTQQDLNVDRKIFRLLRTKLEFSPVFAAPIQFDGHTFGYLRLVNFSMKAPAEMEKAVAQLKRDGAEAFILDLRNNPGGLVRASMDIAGLWMDGNQHPTIFNIEDREGTHSTIARVVLDSGLALTDQPLVVLVNKQSASASEILAAALHDNHRAVVLGEPTFGKGKIQSVFELSDGSALFVTVAKYMTPAGSEIDKIGVLPDKACSPQPNGPAAVPGIPVGPGASERVLEELGVDDCVLSAQSLLEHQVDDYWKSSGGRAPLLVAAPPLLTAGA